MKWHYAIPFVVLLVLLFVLIQPAHAQGPEPLNWMFGATKCTALPLATIQTDYQDFASKYGWDHQFPSGGDIWKIAYPNMVNEYLRRYGCANGLNDEGTALTPWQLHYFAIYRHAAGRGPIP